MVGLPEVVWSKEEERDNMLLLPALLALLSPSLYIYIVVWSNVEEDKDKNGYEPICIKKYTKTQFWV
jgi:hypothetical protein